MAANSLPPNAAAAAADISPQPGPQWAFAETAADIAIYGGEAGGGKSWALVFEGLRHHEDPGFGAVVFRRTSPELTGPESLWAIANDLYRRFGAHMVESPNLAAHFPSGAEIRFLHLQHAADAYSHQGKGYAYIGFDELTHFEEAQFWYLFSRNRTTSGVRPYVRGTCNPDPDSFVRKLIDWWIGPDGTPIAARCGVLRWFIRDGDTLTWADSPEELRKTNPGAEPVSLTFIHARLEDNPALTSKDPGYASRLAALPEVERQRLRGGNWDIRPEGGKYIKRNYFERRWTKKLPELNIYAASDYAVTQKRPGIEPDWTEHGIFGLSPQGDLYVIDWISLQETSDVWIDAQLDLVAKHHPLTWYGEKGVIQAAIEPWLTRRMRERRVYVNMDWVGTSTRAEDRATTTGFADASKRAKAIRGRSFQAMAHSGRIVFPADAPWVARVIDQIVGFPNGKDDIFDAIANMCQALDESHNATAIVPPAPEGPPDYRRPKAKRSWKTI